MSPQADRIPHARVGARDGVGRRFLVPQCLTRETSRKKSTVSGRPPRVSLESPAPVRHHRPPAGSDRSRRFDSAELSSRASSLKTEIYYE